MCGIAGIVGEDRRGLASMLYTLRHRGPDNTTEVSFDDLSISLGHTRLSILDLDSRSDQPISSTCQRYVLTFNGEIYNYLELKADLSSAGYSFHTTSDTEVLLYWLMYRGREGLADLDGMFSVAFLDKETGTLLCARDHVGEKPFYYSIDENLRLFAFASEPRALLQLDWVDRSFDSTVLADFLRFLYVPPPRTFYKGIRELRPGSCIEMDLATHVCRESIFFDLEEQLQGPPSTTPSDVRNRFVESVRKRLASDVPLCIYLSGGIDSTAILGGAKASFPRKDFSTFTMRYSGSQLARQSDEGAVARQTSDLWGTKHREIQFELDRPFLPTIERMLDIFDEPFGNATAIVSDLMAESVSAGFKVALVGDGGDEIAAGYPRYKALLRLRSAKRMPAFVRRIVQKALLRLPVFGPFVVLSRRVQQFAAGLNEDLPEAFLRWSTYLSDAEVSAAVGYEAKSAFAEDLVSAFRRNADDPLKAASIVDLRSFVPHNLMRCSDRTSMAHSIELRSPFLSVPLIESALRTPFGMRAPGRRPKPLLVHSLGALIPRHVVHRKKKPFNPPIHSFLLAHYGEMRDFLLSDESLLPNVLSTDFLRGQVDAFEKREKENSTLLWGLCTLECWLRRNNTGISNGNTSRADDTLPVGIKSVSTHNAI